MHLGSLKYFLFVGNISTQTLAKPRSTLSHLASCVRRKQLGKHQLSCSPGHLHPPVLPLQALQDRILSDPGLDFDQNLHKLSPIVQASWTLLNSYY